MNDMPAPVSPNQAASSRYNLLSALRGLAALGVAIFHLCQVFRDQLEKPHASLGRLLPAFNLGWFGVDVFFLISGYGLAAKLSGDSHLAGARGARLFARNRFWRIYPVYWLCCVFVVLLAYVAHHFNHQDWRPAFPGDLRGALASVLLLEPFTGTPPILPVVTWALNCELGFYALVLLGIMVRPGISDTALICIATGLALAGLAGLMPWLGWLFAFWPQFACGLLLFVAVRQRELHATGPCLAAIAALVVLAAVAWVDTQWRITGAAVAGLLLVALQPADDWLCRQSPLRWLAWCGMISFPLFLLHVPVGTRVLHLGQRMIAPDSAAFGLVLIVALLTSVGAALLFHRWLEQPTHALAKRPPVPAT